MSFNELVYILPLETRTQSTLSEVISGGAKGAVCSMFVDVIPSGTLSLEIRGYDRFAGQTYTILSSSLITASGVTVLKVFPGIAATNNVSKSDVLPYDWKLFVAHTPADLAAKYSVSVSLID